MQLWTPGPGFKVSPAIAAINVIVFLVLVVINLSFSRFSNLSLLELGANYSPLVDQGQWWRLLSSVFLHLSVMHLLFNSVSLLFVGRFLEPLLGHALFLVLYLFTGIGGSLASYYFNAENVISAGASGAIFGLFGVFIAILLSGIIKKEQRDEWLKTIGAIVVINLGLGIILPVDNAAHIGGLMSGAGLGFALVPYIKRRLRRILQRRD